MLLWNIDLLLSNPLLMLVVVGAIAGALLVAITVHEFSHALAAYRLGDSTARYLGRLSLNPLVHLDPLGTIMLLLVGFGWGKPVPVNPAYFSNIGMRQGTALVSAAGPVSNILTAFLFTIPVKLGLLAWHSPMQYSPFARLDAAWFLADVIGYIVLYNVILAIFNLIPLAPLDGFGVALGILPRYLADPLARLGAYGPGILLIVIFMGRFTPFDILGHILMPAVRMVGGLVVGRPIF
ncbi:MAG: site-2 protease family protein [Chloroflexi bacterium]|nr:site-2 protease family protein [Chloroflexota bacterium]